MLEDRGVGGYNLGWIGEWGEGMGDRGRMLGGGAISEFAGCGGFGCWQGAELAALIRKKRRDRYEGTVYRRDGDDQ